MTLKLIIEKKCNTWIYDSKTCMFNFFHLATVCWFWLTIYGKHNRMIRGQIIIYDIANESQILQYYILHYISFTFLWNKLVSFL